VLAGAGAVVGVVVYTGKETRAQMNTSAPSTKVGTAFKLRYPLPCRNYMQVPRTALLVP
jgi:magnesium-transporting ATPase (P-type)